MIDRILQRTKLDSWTRNELNCSSSWDWLDQIRRLCSIYFGDMNNSYTCRRFIRSNPTLSSSVKLLNSLRSPSWTRGFKWANWIRSQAFQRNLLELKEFQMIKPKARFTILFWNQTLALNTEIKITLHYRLTAYVICEKLNIKYIATINTYNWFIIQSGSWIVFGWEEIWWEGWVYYWDGINNWWWVVWFDFALCVVLFDLIIFQTSVTFLKILFFITIHIIVAIIIIMFSTGKRLSFTAVVDVRNCRVETCISWNEILILDPFSY